MTGNASNKDASQGLCGTGVAPVRIQGFGMHSKSVLAAVCGLMLVCATGCPVVDNRAAPGRELHQRDPERNSRYHLYVPSTYKTSGETRRWPLVVACHGTPPWDTAGAQLDEWKGLAEEKGFLLVAPELVGTRGDFLPPPAEQIERQMEDERSILAIVRSLRAAWSIDDTRVFLTGWSAGGYAVLFTGLRHPDVFRALCVRQGNFDAAFVEPCVPFLDRFQPVLVMYGQEDLLKDQALGCIDWLRNHGLDPTVLGRPGIHRRDPEPVFSFFARVVRSQPWIRVVIEDDPRDPMHVRLAARTSFEPARFLWDFGDGEPRSPLASPHHRYGKPGFYDVRLAVWPSSGGPYVRLVRLQMPRMRLGVTATATAPAK
ncbi:MAG TPA: PHB depolymerase family esterase [Phycisphaerae bacterium]|nr:PHB depolymerase family esterase [Phycisphaerae bacterium]